MGVSTIGVGMEYDYSSVSAWISAVLSGNELEEDETGEIFGEIEDEADFTGYTTAGFDTILTAGAGHGTPAFSSSDALTYTSGKGGAIVGTTNSGSAHTIDADVAGRIVLRDIQVKKAANNGQALQTDNASTDFLIERSIVVGGQSNGDLADITVGTTIEAYASLFVVQDADKYAFDIRNADLSATFVNCTFINTNGSSTVPALRLGYGTFHYAQCLFLGWGDAHETIGSPTITGNFSIIDDATATIQGLNSDSSVSGSDEIEAEYTDMRLKTGATSIDFIPSASADGDTSATDIVGQTRTGDVDCGCWASEIGAGSVAFAAEFYRRTQNTLLRL